MIQIFTIGFTQKTAAHFFGLLKNNGVRKLIDIRAHPNSQLAGFCKADHLPFLCKELLNVQYEAIQVFAPSEQLMKDWRARKITYDEYRNKYIAELNQRDILARYDAKQFDGACFLCSEDSPVPCHRKILCEYLKEHCDEEVVIKHLI